VREHLDRAQAERFDASIQDARLVLERASGGDTGLRHALLLEAARVVAAQRRLRLGADVASDALEHALPTASFYARVGLLHVLGEPAFRARFRGDGNREAYGRMTWPLPRLVKAHLASAAALLLAAAAAGLAAQRQRALLAWPGPDAARRWIPALSLALANAAAFALSQDLVEVRYGLFAHVACLAAVYDLALRWLARSRGGPGSGRAAQVSRPSAHDPDGHAARQQAAHQL
jgi:hypothetical protein